MTIYAKGRGRKNMLPNPWRRTSSNRGVEGGGGGGGGGGERG